MKLIRKVIGGLLIVIFVALSSVALAAGSQVIIVKLYGEIDNGRYTGDSPKKIIATIRTLDRGEKLLLYINSLGGRVDVGQSIIDAIRTSKGIVVGVLVGQSYSMAAEILVSCPEIVVKPGAGLVMIHAPSRMDKNGRLIFGDPEIRWFEKQQKVRWARILTKKEIYRIYSKEHTEIYLSAVTFKNRVCSAVHKGC